MIVNNIRTIVARAILILARSDYRPARLADGGTLQSLVKRRTKRTFLLSIHADTFLISEIDGIFQLTYCYTKFLVKHHEAMMRSSLLLE